ncbi:MAG: thioesterase [Calditrichaeota bacterium]|nr:MAG: thioesterase [Calditrichota bacterium]
MNLYLRLLLLTIKSFFMKKTTVNEAGCLSFRIWPHDLDINGHLTNARYLSFMDLGRTFFIVQNGILKWIMRKRWMPVANAVEITFIRELKPFTHFDLHTKLICWDAKYWYFEQRFMVGETLHALAHIRGVFVHNGRVIRPQSVISLIDPVLQSPAEPAVIKEWKLLLDAKKDANQNSGRGVA